LPYSLLLSVRPVLCLCRKPLLCVSLFVLVLATGCQTHAPHTSSPVSVRPTAVIPAAVTQVQSSALYQQARQDCTRHDFRLAADHLQQLARTPGLAPDALAFVEKQREICLRDAGIPSPASVVVTTSVPARSPADADCGPRALLLVCQKLGVKTNVETLRKLAGTTAEGTTMAGLEQAAQKLGLKAEGVQVSREALPDISPLAIAWDRRQHFIVVKSLDGNGDRGTARIHDPNRPVEETISQESLLQRSGGVLLLVHR
jgi:hypothetical protein